jgi:WhiB family redox-sensing transcriptional regulator
MVAQPVWLEDDGESFLLGVAANVPAWQRDALCVEHPEVEWFGSRGYTSAAAKAICAKCLCQKDCLAFALDEELDDGVWGGANSNERKALAARGVTGDLVRKYGQYVGAGRELELDLAALGTGCGEEYERELALLLAELDDDD